ncbi:DUF2510 domain-containing protein [Schaalia odontolytica]|uniref:DUF2510 domain-containing protein n=1 Tax=Schaalia odontolytica TaxID=1660 RepID=UPI001D078E75|nr:DUF2510 domain-containing protein [Schaalia odontolytica]MCB6402350.1 DUF2510 domain-containing protein [Schaalia odontolytica]
MSNPVEGWYPDPAGTAQLRWWDGYSWTDDYLPDDTAQDYGADSYSEADQAYTYDAGYRDAAPTDDAGYQDAAPTYDAGYRDAAPTDGSVPQARPKAPAKQLATTVILSLLIAAFTVGAIATTSLFLSANKEYKQAEQTLNQANEDLQTVQGESK